MSEYVEIEVEPVADADEVIVNTNVTLVSGNAEQGVESYQSPAQMEEGSPLAQTLAQVDGIRALRISGQTMTVTREPGADWHVIVADLSAAVRDFFL
ncbi:MAG TPA: NifU N-terminal domain-containing protein [Candidatus Binatia bacterium]|nr:NifU N-terminal domain-containing protein [Candidatus Binatia bacterium]